MLLTNRDRCRDDFVGRKDCRCLCPGRAEEQSEVVFTRFFDAASHSSSKKAIRWCNCLVFYPYIHEQEPTRTALPIQDKLALNWLCFFAIQNHDILHNPFLYRYLRSFHPFNNWLCFFKSPIGRISGITHFTFCLFIKLALFFQIAFHCLCHEPWTTNYKP